eukprot:8821785-Alexandrium_andersonii.AAC.1
MAAEPDGLVGSARRAASLAAERIPAPLHPPLQLGNARLGAIPQPRLGSAESALRAPQEGWEAPPSASTAD